MPDDLNALGIPTRFKKLRRVLRSKKYNRIYENKWTRNNVKSVVSNDLYYKDEYIYAQNSKFDFVKPVILKKEPTKLDVYIHYNFNSLVEENIGEITPRWANGGGSSPSVYLKNPEDIALVLANVEDNSINVDLTFKKKIKVI